MSKTEDTSKFGHATFEDHCTLDDAKLDAATGGRAASGSVGALGYTSHIPMGLPLPPFPPLPRPAR
jgi:hypothetical protein